MRIPFNKPYFPRRGFAHIRQAVQNGKLSGNGRFTAQCHQFFCVRYGLRKALLTSSCTDALEMAALLARIAPGDEVIIPSFTFPSTANAFVLRGARIVFADSGEAHPNLDVSTLDALITEKTRAIVPVHYAGVACDMDPLMRLAARHRLWVIEDAAQAVDAVYKGRSLGSIGHLAAFSFHETKNISSGEGGMLVVNDAHLEARAEIVWEKGTNRAAFFRGEIDKYGWVDVGSSFLPSELTAAVLYAQLERLTAIQRKRVRLWQRYQDRLRSAAEAGFLSLPCIPEYATHNAHLFYVLCRSEKERDSLIDYLKRRGIATLFHYLPLHRSPFFKEQHDGRALPRSEFYSARLLRLPLYYHLTLEHVDEIASHMLRFFGREAT
jgi:dTDP-4-amino-4,6-dideoxygalactose transaminase